MFAVAGVRLHGCMTNRTVLVWLHVLTSVGWMSMALAIATLLWWGLANGEPAAFEMADVIDDELLRHLATASAYSGFMLSALTAWGYFRYWWVLMKAAITVVQLSLGIFLLGQNLDGNPGWPLVIASLLMAGAFAYQAWLSLRKPWKLTPWSGRRRPATAPGWQFLAVAVVPVLDYLLWRAPLLSLLVVLGYPGWRAYRANRAAATTE